MAEGKKVFNAYCDWKDIFDALPDDKAGQLIKHILAYVNDDNPETDDVLINAVFAGIKATLKRDLKKWEEKKRERSKSGIMGNLKRYNKDLYDDVVSETITFEEAQNVAKSRLARKKVAKLAVKDRDRVRVKDIVSTNVDDNNIYNTRFSFKKSMCDLGIEKTLVEDFMKNRKMKRLANTETAFKNLKTQLEKNEMPINELMEIIISNGWGSFKNSWLKKEKSSAQKEKNISLAQAMREEHGLQDFR